MRGLADCILRSLERTAGSQHPVPLHARPPPFAHARRSPLLLHPHLRVGPVPALSRDQGGAGSGRGDARPRCKGGQGGVRRPGKDPRGERARRGSLGRVEAARGDAEGVVRLSEMFHVCIRCILSFRDIELWLPRRLRKTCPHKAKDPMRRRVVCPKILLSTAKLEYDATLF